MEKMTGIHMFIGNILIPVVDRYGGLVVLKEILCSIGLCSTRTVWQIDALAFSTILWVLFFWLSVIAIKFGFRKVHICLQVGITIFYLVVFSPFEVFVRFEGWRVMAEPSPYYHSWVQPLLVFHLIFAILTVVVWGYSLFLAKKAFVTSARDHNYSRMHKKMGRVAFGLVHMTAATGCLFYWMAFVL